MLMFEFIAKQKGIKSTEIASMVGVSPQTVYKWFKKINSVPIEHLEKISKEWNVNMVILNQEVSSEMVGDIEKENTLSEVNLLLNKTKKFKKPINVILQPASKEAKENYKKTILRALPYEVLVKHLTPNQIEMLKEIYNGEEPQVWAVKNADDGGNKKQFKKISEGDLALFYGDWRYYSQMEITYLLENATLGAELWNDPEYVNFYFVTNVKNINVPVELVNKAISPFKHVDLKDYRNPLLRFRVLDAESSDGVLDVLDIEVASHLIDYSEDEFKEAIMLDIDGALDIVSKRASRVEQGFLRKKLFGKKVFFNCACCGEKLPTSMLIAAHIKKRSLCTTDEKLNTRIVIPMCKLGCDSLLEDGYIGVGDNGEFVQLDNANKLKITPRLNEYIKSVVGNKCCYWDRYTETLFKWHVQYHTEK